MKNGNLLTRFLTRDTKSSISDEDKLFVASCFAMQGMLQSCYDRGVSPKRTAQDSVICAKELLKLI